MRTHSVIGYISYFSLCLIIACGSKRIGVTMIDKTVSYTIIVLEDKTVYVALTVKNPHLKNISSSELAQVKYVYFGSYGRMYLEGTQCVVSNVSLGRISLEVVKR